jgi:hypothetical protein
METAPTPLLSAATLTSPSQVLPTIRNLIVLTKTGVRVIMIMMPRLQDFLTLHAVIESRTDQPPSTRDLTMTESLYPMLKSRHIGHEPRDEIELVGATSVHETDEPPIETLTAKAASTASVVNSNGTEPLIVYSHHSYTELAASSSEHISFDNCVNTCTIIDRTIIDRTLIQTWSSLLIDGVHTPCLYPSSRPLFQICIPQHMPWMDRKPTLNVIASELWNEDHLKVVMTPPEAHEHYIEREIRSVKEHLRAFCERAPCKLLRIAIEGLAFDTITLLNHVTTKDTYPESPKSLVCGDRLNLA